MKYFSHLVEFVLIRLKPLLYFSDNMLKQSAIFIILFITTATLGCERMPKVPHGPKKSGDNGYRIYIGNEPSGYQPGKIYNGT